LKAISGGAEVSKDAMRSTDGRGDVCPRCHGSKGTGGIFGCKCVDNSRLLKDREEGRKKGENEAGGDKEWPRTGSKDART
jgi:hypothetical protein